MEIATSTQIGPVDPYRQGRTAMAPEAHEAGFDDILDVINPLHHIPLIGFLYRAITGDTISPASAMAGGALFGGPLGLIGALASQAYESVAEEPPLATVARLIAPDPEMPIALAAYRRAGEAAQAARN